MEHKINNMGKSKKDDPGYTPEQILEQLRKIQEEENKIYGRQGAIPFSDNEKALFDTEEESLISDSEDPALCKKFFYRLQTIINANIKKGKIRDFVNNEKKLYLKSIGNSGDSRFSFKNSLDKLLKIATNWASTDTNGFELGLSFYELNEIEGFHKEKNINKANSTFDYTLKNLMKVPPPKKNE